MDDLMEKKKLEVAVFNEKGILIAVREVAPEDHVTDRARRQMALSLCNDVKQCNMIGRYKISPEYDSLEPIWELFPADVFATLHAAALSQWQTVEYSIFILFDGFLHARHPNASSSIFFSLTHFDLKIKTTDALVKAVGLNPDHLTQWDKLYKRSRDCAIARNHLAHFGTLWMTNVNGTHPVLTDSPFDNRRKGRTYTQKQLEDTWRSFTKLATDLMKFTGCIGISRPAPRLDP